LPAGQAAVSITSARRTPVGMPLRSTVYSRSSVAMLPVAAGANGQPPMLVSSAATPQSHPGHG
jgi:hypothetical protein